MLGFILLGAKLKRKTKANTEALLAGGVLSTETRL